MVAAAIKWCVGGAVEASVPGRVIGEGARQHILDICTRSLRLAFYEMRPGAKVPSHDGITAINDELIRDQAEAVQWLSVAEDLVHKQYEDRRR